MKYLRYILVLIVGLFFFSVRPVWADCCGQVVCDGPVGSQCKHACSNWWPCTCTCSATCGGSIPPLPPPDEPIRPTEPPQPTATPRPTATAAPLPTATPTNTPTPTPRLPTRTITQSLTEGLTSQSSGKTITNLYGVTEAPVLRQVCLVTQDCSDATAGCTVQTEHRVRLTTKPGYTALPDSEAYITECLLVGSSSICTSGDRTVDSDYFGYKVGGKSNLDYLSDSPAIQYRFNGLFSINGNAAKRTSNPVVSDSQGNLGIHEWESRTQNQYERLFFAVNNLSDTKAARSNDYALKQGTWTYENNVQNCVIIAWDPSGYIYDEETNKPIQDAEITLLKENKNGEYVSATSQDIPGNFINPMKSDAQGYYNFQTPPGKYKLKVSAPGYKSYVSDTIVQTHDNKQVNIYLYPEKSTISSLLNSVLNIFR